MVDQHQHSSVFIIILVLNMAVDTHFCASRSIYILHIYWWRLESKIANLDSWLHKTCYFWFWLQFLCNLANFIPPFLKNGFLTATRPLRTISDWFCATVRWRLILWVLCAVFAAFFSSILCCYSPAVIFFPAYLISSGFQGYTTQHVKINCTNFGTYFWLFLCVHSTKEMETANMFLSQPASN